MGNRKQQAVSDYRMVTVEGAGPKWKRTIAVHLTGKVWVPGIGGMLQDALFNGEPILEAEGRAFVAIDDILKHPLKDAERVLFETIRDRFSKVVHSD